MRFITGLTPSDVAVDANHLYWGDSVLGTIGRANLDGTGVNLRFIRGVAFPTGVAVDANHVYWSDLQTGTIGRASMDGTGVNLSFITGATNPQGVAVDAG